MERAHREFLSEMAPDLKDHIFLLREFGADPTPDEPDMPDPTGSDKTDDFTELLELLEAEIPRFFKVLGYRIEDLNWEKENTAE